MDNSAAIKVSVIPPASDLAGNAIFEGRRPGGGAHSPNIHWMDTFAALHRFAREQNILLGTQDVLPLSQADMAVYLTQPLSPHDIEAVRKAHPGMKLVLVLLETSLGARYMLNPANHAGFDAVVTYCERLVDHKKYFPMRTRAFDRNRIRTGLAFEERKVSCLVGTNRKMRWRSGIGAMLKGWRYSPRDWIDYVFCPGELITYRSKIGRLCAGYPEGTFDIYGEGWDIHPETRDRCLGIPSVSTLEYAGRYRYSLSLENHGSADSLISERIWDALWGDTVPVYMGNTHIARHLPSDCFVDARAFSDPAKLLRFLVEEPKEKWEARRRAGREFIMGKAVERRLPEACGRELLEPIALLAAQIRATRRASRAVLPA